MAARTLGLAPDTVPTVTGGLTFFGAPLNTYMANAACAMTRRLRAGGGTGLLYGQGEFVTKHHAVVVSSSAPRGQAILADPSVQPQADARRGPVPAFSTIAEGPGSIETFTILYDRDGAASHGVVIARLQTGERVLTRVLDGIGRLTDMAQSPIGLPGSVTSQSDELHWHFA
jgi:acetyl-CoA C-acetyltransferase